MRRRFVLATVPLIALAPLTAQKPVPRTFEALPAHIEVPTVEGGARVRSPIDAFVRARLERERLRPTRQAEPSRLIRRAALTLTGLPPSPEQVDAFLADTAPLAFERAVDRLLGSVRYAEHMTATWLDAARYADTYGYQSDVHREVWPWRDWVISAFDSNLPYDRFLTWQLAGDLLPDATRESTLATCFLRLHRQTNEGGSVEEEYRVEYVCDRVETIGTAMLGVTFGCAKCHDHKNDPIAQREYYALFAMLDDADESGLYSHFTDAVPTPTLRLPTPKQELDLAAAARGIGAAEFELERVTRSRETAFADWLQACGATLGIPGASGHFTFDSIGTDGLLDNEVTPELRGRTADSPTLTDGIAGRAIALSGEDNASFPKVADFGRDDPFTILCFVRVVEHHDRAVVWHRSRAWTDAGSRGYELLLEDGRPSAALIHFWPGNAIRVVASDPLVPGRWTHLAVSYDGSGRADGLRIFIDGAEAVTEVSRDALRREITGGGADALTLGQRFRDKGLRGGAVDELWVYPRALAPLEIGDLARSETLSQALARRGEIDVRDQLRLVYFAAHDEVVCAACEALRTARRARTEIVESIREIMVMRDDYPAERVAHRLVRGAYDNPSDAIDPDVPAVFGTWPEGAPRNRLGLAQWLTDPDHPLTARVLVNRVWAMHFGRGLCPTTEDLGNAAAPSSHPELLDWLARWFVDSGWDLKALHRLIVTSATWRQDSRCDDALRARDPQNEWLARGPSFRLSAEAIRDSALAVSGLLVPRVGGPSVKPYQPPGLWEEKSGASYVADDGEGLWRRSLYTYQKRTSPPPAMTTFDAGAREVCTVRRQTTTSPLQALLLMNDPQHVEAARALAARVLGDHEAVDARLDALLRRVLSRPARPEETAVLRAAVAQEKSGFQADPAAARALCEVGRSPLDPTLDPIELATWTTIASTVLCLDEAIVLR